MENFRLQAENTHTPRSPRFVRCRALHLLHNNICVYSGLPEGEAEWKREQGGGGYNSIFMSSECEMRF